MEAILTCPLFDESGSVLSKAQSHYEMAEGHTEFTQSVCVCFRLCKRESCPAHNFIRDGGMYK